MEKPVKSAVAKNALSFAFVVGTSSLAFVVSQLDVSIVNVALPQISMSFVADISELQWIIDAYTIAFAVLMLSAGGMGDCACDRNKCAYFSRWLSVQCSADIQVFEKILIFKLTKFRKLRKFNLTSEE
jgi:hypothetical protein